jgi:hypothetical protein
MGTVMKVLVLVALLGGSNVQATHQAPAQPSPPPAAPPAAGSPTSPTPEPDPCWHPPGTPDPCDPGGVRQPAGTDTSTYGTGTTTATTTDTSGSSSTSDTSSDTSRAFTSGEWLGTDHYADERQCRVYGKITNIAGSSFTVDSFSGLRFSFQVDPHSTTVLEHRKPASLSALAQGQAVKVLCDIDFGVAAGSPANLEATRVTIRPFSFR